MTATELPSPLVPAEVDLTDFQYMELDVKKLRDSRFAAEVEPEAFRAGVLLWCASWHQVPAASLPNNDVELSTLAGFGRVVREWKKVREQALELFVLCSDGRLYHRIVAEKANSAWRSRLDHFYERAKDRLRKANKARSLETPPRSPLPELTFDVWNERRLTGQIPMERAEAFDGIPPKNPPTSKGNPPERDLKGNGDGTERKGNGEGESFVGTPAPPVPPSPPPPPAPDKPAGTRGTRLPPEWQLPRSWAYWALDDQKHWTEEIVRRVAEDFKDHWIAEPGRDGLKLDWQATWRKWCRSPITQKAFPKSGVAGKGPSPADIAARDREIDERMGIGAAPLFGEQEQIDG